MVAPIRQPTYVQIFVSSEATAIEAALNVLQHNFFQRPEALELLTRLRGIQPRTLTAIEAALEASG
ncbi:MAG TPA: hypothetical protein VG935_00680 [Patescibacteria group bacterium]|nr:hypothetical protein [Patescibacteria group bacterium]